MGGTQTDVKLLVDGKRTDGRGPGDMRPFKIEAGVLERADGSAYVELGETHAYASVYGPVEMHPRHALRPDKGVLKVRYNMLPFSVSDRKRPGPDRRSREIGKVTREAFESVVLLEKYPRSAIEIDINVVQADAGTRVVGLTAASVALADAGIAMTDLLSSCAAGKIDGTVVLDLNGIEDNCGEADVPVAVTGRGKHITLLQMDGLLTKDELSQAIKYATDGCNQLYEAQKDALRRRYK
ncbi:MAG: exosome complex exonuclease Rrp41 [SAR324 cluster bacterium]|jgi:exosome complex component RRP41|nr:exosome complex exonuclease Rrp41 [SAR324 cluster bacterium]